MRVRMLKVLVCLFFLCSCINACGSSNSDSPIGDNGYDSGSGTDGDDYSDSDSDSCDPAFIVAAISREIIEDGIAELSELQDRESHAGQQAAAGIIMDWLDSAGVDYEPISYTYEGKTYVNIEVEFLGDELPDEIYIAGAHYDAHAPGADDNASGSSGLAEIARMMSGCVYRRTIRLVFFSNEEAGAIGSQRYAATAANENENIRAFLALDMIAYGPAGEDLDVTSRPAYTWLVERVVDATQSYTDLPVREVIDESCG